MKVESTGVVVVADRLSTGAGEELARSSRLHHLGRFDTLRTAFDAGRAFDADILLVELAGPDRLRELTAGLPTAPGGAQVVVVSSLPTEAALLPALAGGARGFVLSPLEPLALERAVAAVLAGRVFVDERSVEWLVDLALHQNRRRVPDRLTFRQAQVVELVRTGLTNQEIATLLGVSLATVKSHMHAAMQQLGVADRWAATVLARQLREERR